MWRLEITPGLSGALTIVGLLLGAASLVGVVLLAGALHPDLGRTSVAVILVAALLSIPVTLVLHEAVHGLAFLAFGGRPRFGARVRAGMPYLYAACPGQRFARDPFLAVGLAPLVVLDLVGLALMLPSWSAPFGASMVVINTAGAIGDLWAVMVLLQSPRWTHVEDSGLGFVAWAPPERSEEAARRRPPIALDLPALRWVGPWLIAMVVATGPVTFVLLDLAGGHPGARVQIGPLVVARGFKRGAIVNVPDALVVSALVATMALLTASAVRRLWRRRRRP